MPQNGENISRVNIYIHLNTTRSLNAAIARKAPKDDIEMLRKQKDMAHKFADSKLKPIQEYRDYLKVQKKKSTKGSKGSGIKEVEESIFIMMPKNY